MNTSRMKKAFNVLLSTTLLTGIIGFAPFLTQPALADDAVTLKDQASIDQVIKALTQAQKLSLISGASQSLATGAAGATAAVPSLGITQVVVADGPTGLRLGAGRSTQFPNPTSLSASFDKNLIYEVGEAIGKELRVQGVDEILGPGLNIQRDPRNGRNFEYYSEDPYLAGKSTVEYTKGVQSQGVGVTLKHFAANNQETNRSSINATISERALREIYLSAFEMGVKEANPWSVMTSYNKVNGTWMSENKTIVGDILRGEWGYKGLVMSDWGGVHTAVDMLKAGSDLGMPSTNTSTINTALNNGTLDPSYLDDAVRHVLSTVIKSPRFKGDYAGYAANKGVLRTADPALYTAHQELARKSASEGMVLLKNNANTLPFKQEVQKVGIVGTNQSSSSCFQSLGVCSTANAAVTMYTAGTGSGYVAPESASYVVQLPEGLTNAGYTPIYTNADNTANLTQSLTAQEADSLASRSDIGVIVMGRDGGEGTDNTANNINTTAAELTFIDNVSTAFHAQNKKVVAVLDISQPLIVDDWKDKVDAILVAWLPGQQAGNAIVDILKGAVNPSGKLPVTFPKKLEDIPTVNFGNTNNAVGSAAANVMFPGTGGVVNYSDDIYVGYRYYDTSSVNTANKEPQYPFGYGLSYTTFDYSNLRINSKNQTVSVDVTNKGSVKGSEVVQLYIHDGHSQINRAEKELKGYEKLSLLPGETKTATFALDKRSFAYYDTVSHDWVAEPGKYDILVGSSSRDIRQTGAFNLQETPVNSVVLSGDQDVQPGQSFDLTYGLGKVNQDVYAQDITVTYDPEFVEFVSAESLSEDFKILETGNKQGKIRVIAAQLGTNHQANGDFIKFHWKAKSPVATASSVITVNAISADAQGVELNLNAASHNFQITVVDKAALISLIADAQSKHDAAVEGTRTGQYPVGSKATLQAAIDAATLVLNNSGVSQSQIQQAVSNLNAALQAFIASVNVSTPGDLNDDGKFTIGDLAIVAAAYGKSSTDSDWVQYKKADVNNDGKVDIEDLAAVARQILNQS
ncbi:glycoside hydrolase family 3 C-terminal domain-containing protein [Paenibacillus planticolens]|uniref:Beta-glucosidase n=1 Tax=Paenibacillus planticolens TaxID=2654976 RepID=A0ABX1ZMG4_9BACL|nr:glycoside hydrolase family 3 N-terminal domain-containing protein [Paenibacillus planticolens]NOV01285.1 hypothetical protein [Paenibacillus planticolens]